eukprot:jgi/Mesen1/5504/ME000277S04718
METQLAEGPLRLRLMRPAYDCRAVVPQQHPADRWMHKAQSDGWITHLEESATSADSDIISVLVQDPPRKLPEKHSFHVPHVRQLYNWDCGLACVLMVLRALHPPQQQEKGVALKDFTLKELSKACGTSSIWTVDLAHLLRCYALDVTFLTVTIGANPSFARETFYQENMEEDGKRVNRLFEKAAQVGICLQRRSVSGEELASLLLSGFFLAIALVDKRKLSHPWTDLMCLPECCGMNPGYTGHYVVLCGFDQRSQEYEIRDPASSSEVGKISADALEEARKTYGTDEDLLLVRIPSSLR